MDYETLLGHGKMRPDNMSAHIRALGCGQILNISALGMSSTGPDQLRKTVISLIRQSKLDHTQYFTRIVDGQVWVGRRKES